MNPLKTLKDKSFGLLILAFMVSVFSQGQNMNEQSGDSISVCDTFFNTYILCDKFRWLENNKSEKVKTWVSGQSKFTKDYLKKCRSKSYSTDYMSQYSDIIGYNAIKCGKYYFTTYGQSEFSSSAIGIRTSINAPLRLLTEFSKVDKNSVIQIEELYASPDSKYLAYEFSRNGSDSKEIKVVDLKTEKELPDHIVGARYGAICWFGNGFCYTMWDTKSELDAVENALLYYHRLGTPQSEDKVIYKRNDAAKNTFRYYASMDGRFLFISDRNAKSKMHNLYKVDVADSLLQLYPVFRNQNKSFGFLEMIDQSLIGYTVNDSVSYSILRIDLSDPYEWKLLFDQPKDRAITDMLCVKNRLVVLYMKDQKPLLCIYNLGGEVLYELGFPPGSSVSIETDNVSDDNELFFAVRDYTTPSIFYTLNIHSYELQNHNAAKVNYDFSDFVKEQVNYRSKDGTEVSMTLVYDKSKRKSAAVPCILEAYGGFNSINEPSFDPGVVYLIRNGGIYAFANIRGGGDKGIEWSRAGRGKYKQNSFDDFITAAEFLINSGYTTSDMLGTVGYSNGGLVVAAAAMQRPDLFKAVVPVVAPLDMIRFENFTVGSFHHSEYGTVTDSSGFTGLLKYSPLHNIRNDVNYPSMLIVTGESDDRVPPFHSYKFVAAMKANSTLANPVLLLSSENAGHSGPLIFNDRLILESSIFGFLLYEISK